MKSQTKKIAYAGVFIAANIVLKRFLSQTILIGGVQTLRLSFGEIPTIISSIILGPFYGAISGALADLIGFPINAQGAYFPGFTLSEALVGFLPGLLIRLFRNKLSWVSIGISVAITVVITSIGLNTLWLHMMFGKAYVLLLPPRILAAAVLIPIYVIVTRLFLKHFKHISNSSL